LILEEEEKNQFDANLATFPYTFMLFKRNHHGNIEVHDDDQEVLLSFERGPPDSSSEVHLALEKKLIKKINAYALRSCHASSILRKRDQISNVKGRNIT